MIVLEIVVLRDEHSIDRSSTNIIIFWWNGYRFRVNYG